MKKIIVSAFLAAASATAMAYQVDETDYSVLAYKETSDGTVDLPDFFGPS